jgi:hypothetical protein
MADSFRGTEINEFQSSLSHIHKAIVGVDVAVSDTK